jgi:hypothetical protein
MSGFYPLSSLTEPPQHKIKNQSFNREKENLTSRLLLVHIEGYPQIKGYLAIEMGSSRPVVN